MEIAFTEWRTPEGEWAPIETALLRLDNAREQVDKNGRVRGILAASNPLGIVRGIWFRPSPGMLVRAPVGLTGPVGTAWARFALGPIGAAGLFGSRLLLIRMPDPEIDLPAGAELTLRLLSESPGRIWGQAPQESTLDEPLHEFLRTRPVDIGKQAGGSVADVINVALIGSRDLLERAFRAAGWVSAEPLNRASFGKTYRAFTRRQGYPTAPVSKLVYQGRLPDVVFQKSLNSIAKRHHVRFWRTETEDGREIWLGAATHDVTVIFDRSNFSLSHRIDPRLDLEREKVMGDLDFAAGLASRASVKRQIVVEQEVVTDGTLAVGLLKPAEANFEILDEERVRKTSAVRRVVRRIALETRHHLLRENTYYLCFLAGKLLHRAPAQKPGN